MLSEFRGQSLHIRESRRQVLREVPNVSGENHLALSIQGVRDLHPVCDDALPCFEELGSGRFGPAPFPWTVSRLRSWSLVYLLDLTPQCSLTPQAAEAPAFEFVVSTGAHARS